MTGSTGITISLPTEQGLEISLSGKMSQKEFEEFCKHNPGLQLEREPDGKIWIMPPVHLDSGFYEGEVFAELKIYSRKDGRGRAYSPSTGFRLPDGSTRSADASWVSNQQLDKLSPKERKSFARVTPEFVIEVRSDTDSLPKLKRKMVEAWIGNGVQLAWLIDPLERKAYIYRADGSVEVVPDFEVSLNGEKVLPGFKLDLNILLDK